MATLPSTVASGDSAGGTPAGPLPGIPPPPPALAATPGHPALLPPAGAVAKQVVPLTGAVAQGDAGRPVAVQVSSGAADWADVGTVASAADGSFSVRWRPTLTGPVAMRAVLADPEGAEAADADPVLQLNVYRRVRASWYGPGFYGGRTACGRRLSPGMLGVANKSLPCGTQVELFYGGRSIVVPVIDRGPYANGASFDLTKITADRLGVDGVFNVGYAIIPV